VAEIPIRRKEGRNIWPLLIGLIALAAVLWFVFARDSTPDTAAARADSAAVVTPGVTPDSAAGTATTPPPTTSTPRTDSTGRP
jgi:hypothetical protein